MKLENNPESRLDDTINIILRGRLSASEKTSPSILLNTLLRELCSLFVSSPLFSNVRSKRQIILKFSSQKLVGNTVVMMSFVAKQNSFKSGFEHCQ